MIKNEKIKFIFKVTIIHVITYVVCGIVFSQIFNYQSSLIDSSTRRDMSSIIVKMAPLFQIIRGILFGIVLVLIRNSYINNKYGWLRVWLILIILGIFNTPGTASFSIEEFIYLYPSKEPLSLQIGGLLEILIQTLLFSILVTVKKSSYDKKNIKQNI